MMLLSGSKLVSFALDRPPVISPLPLFPFHKLSGRGPPVPSKEEGWGVWEAIWGFDRRGEKRITYQTCLLGRREQLVGRRGKRREEAAWTATHFHSRPWQLSLRIYRRKERRRNRGYFARDVTQCIKVGFFAPMETNASVSGVCSFAREEPNALRGFCTILSSNFP